jgi:glutathione S-transferase
MNTLIYFAARGRGEVIRLALAEAGAEWKDETFTMDEFPKLKESGRLPFLAVPVWVEDGGFTLAQSAAILQHVGRTHGLTGTTLREQALVDQALGAVEDVRGEIRKLAIFEPAKRPEVRVALASTILPRWFAMLEKLIGPSGFLAGESVTTADLALYYLLEVARDNDFANVVAAAPRLDAFMKRIAARPKIAAYLASPRRFALQKLPG